MGARPVTCTCGADVLRVKVANITVTVDAQPDPDGRYAVARARHRYGFHGPRIGYLITDLHPLRPPYVAHRKHQHRETP